MSEFVHHPLGPVVSNEPYSDQRRFFGESKSNFVSASGGLVHASLMRFEYANTVFLDVECNSDAGCGSARIALGVSGLRDLAQRLLDAAYDIEMHPAEEFLALRAERAALCNSK